MVDLSWALALLNSQLLQVKIALSLLLLPR
jgi:hypothetical protein